MKSSQKMNDATVKLAERIKTLLAGSKLSDEDQCAALHNVASKIGKAADNGPLQAVDDADRTAMQV